MNTTPPRTSYFSLLLNNPENVLVMDAPNNLTWAATEEYGVLSPLIVSQGGDPALQTGQSMFVESVRLWSNFADGLVFQEGGLGAITPATPGFALWEGALAVGDVLPTDYLLIQFRTLNEWVAVNKPLPRNQNTLIGSPRGFPLAKLFTGASEFLTKSINPTFNTEKVWFALEAMISCSYK